MFVAILIFVPKLFYLHQDIILLAILIFVPKLFYLHQDIILLS